MISKVSKRFLYSTKNIYLRKQFSVSTRATSRNAPTQVEPNHHPSYLTLQTSSDITRQNIPQNLSDAFIDRRAIVVTEPTHPFRIVAVNPQWEELCGYTQKESKGETLARLIQGPKTNIAAVKSVVHKASLFGASSAVICNYSKDGREFRNRLQVGPLKDHTGKITHFVGVLEEVNPLCDRSFDDRYSMHSSMTTIV